MTVTAAGGTSANLQFTYQAAPSVTGVSPASGPTTGGTTVTITGTNLAGATAVDFGKTKVTHFTVNSDGTAITVTAPRGKVGAVNVTVVTAGGTSTTSSADQFTYAVAPQSSGLKSTNAQVTDAALRALLLDDSTVAGKPHSLFES